MNGVSISRNPCSYSVCAHRERYLRAQNDIALHPRTAQIDIAVLEPRLFRNVHFVFHRKRRRARFVQYPDLRDGHFHFAGVEIRVDGLGRALDHRAFHRDHVFGCALPSRACHHLRIGVLPEDELRDAFAVAQVHEEHAAQVAAAMHPAHQDGGLAFVGGAQLAAGMGAAKVAEKIECYGVSISSSAVRD